MNNTTRKHPRTMQEAFGPYTSGILHEPADQFDGKDFIYTITILGLALASAIVFSLWG